MDVPNIEDFDTVLLSITNIDFDELIRRKIFLIINSEYLIINKHNVINDSDSDILEIKISKKNSLDIECIKDIDSAINKIYKLFSNSVYFKLFDLDKIIYLLRIFVQKILDHDN